jgi:hypothetical protein
VDVAVRDYVIARAYDVDPVAEQGQARVVVDELRRVVVVDVEGLDRVVACAHDRHPDREMVDLARTRDRHLLDILEPGPGDGGRLLRRSEDAMAVQVEGGAARGHHEPVAGHGPTSAVSVVLWVMVSPHAGALLTAAIAEEEPRATWEMAASVEPTAMSREQRNTVSPSRRRSR